MRKRKITENLFAKTAAFFGAVASLCVMLVCIWGVVWTTENEFYQEDADAVVRTQIARMARERGDAICRAMENGSLLEEVILPYRNTNLQFEAYYVKGDYIRGEYDGTAAYAFTYCYDNREQLLSVSEERIPGEADGTDGTVQADGADGTESADGAGGTGGADGAVQADGADGTESADGADGAGGMENVGETDAAAGIPENCAYRVTVYLREGLPAHDAFRMCASVVYALYPLCGRLIPAGLLAAFIGISLFIFLMCSAGHQYGQTGVKAKGLSGLPMDLLTAVLLLAGMWWRERIAPSVEMLRNFGSDAWDQNDLTRHTLVLGLTLICGVGLAVGYCMIAAIQLRAEVLGERSLSGKLWRFGKKGLKSVGRLMSVFLKHLVLFWKLPLLLVLVIVVELAIIFFAEDRGMWAVWIAERIVLMIAVPYFGVVLYQLKTGGQELAGGNLNYQVDTDGMFGECRRHGENLNSLGERMNEIVEERMKSERMKTELITNVSHDIKTPLTSIINYTNLIVNEQTENRKITEYSLVLKRQSARLKKLIEDLVEVSKASTGNVEVHLAPCEADVLLTQVVGEYEQRLAEKELELITRLSAQSARIMADGKLLWRVFDNLLNNILKYAQGGTRVYLTVEESGGIVEIAFKNVSRYQLDITPDELRERFVRGDHARNTEGNGLGLSIAESLTRLQNGEMLLSVDGDLFKVLLRFPALPEEGNGVLLTEIRQTDVIS